MRTRLPLAILATAALALPPGLKAVPFWTFDNGGGDANFGTAANWDSNTVPGANEGAVINGGSPNMALLITSDQMVDTLRINDGRTVTQTAGTLTISPKSSGTNELGLWVGEYGWNNVYNMQGGSIVIQDNYDGIILGKNGNSQGTLNFSGGTITNTAGDTFIGADREGEWNQTGGTFTAGTVYLARWGSPNWEKGFVYLDGGTFAATRVQKGDGNEAFFNFNGGTLQARASVTDFFHSMTRANVRNGGAIIDTNGYNVTVSQALLHSDIGGDNATDGGLAKNGTGTLTMTGWSDYTGDTNINAGTLAIGTNGSLYNGGAIAGNIKVNNSGTLSFQRTDTFGNAAHTNPVTLTVNAGGDVTSNNNFNSIRTIVLNGGTITANGGLYVDGIGEIGAYGFNGTVTANGGVTSTIANGGGSNNFIRIGRENTNDSTTFSVAEAAGVLAVNVPFTNNFPGTGGGTNGLVKSGPGTMVVAAASTYTGATQVNAGTLVMGDAASDTFTTSGVTVASGATLGGSGTISGGTVTLNAESSSGAKDGGTLAPGNSIGTLTVNNLNFNTNSIFEWEMNYDGTGVGTRGTNYDAVNVTHSITGPGGAIFQIVLPGSSNFYATFWNTNRIWADIFMAGSPPTGNYANWAGSFGGGLQYFNTSGSLGTPPATEGYFTLSGNSLTWTAVPEAGNALAGLLLVAGLLRRRRCAGA